ncbi:MAG: hypothetical protein ABI876_00125 [Bacteroidota bacterium]
MNFGAKVTLAIIAVVAGSAFLFAIGAGRRNALAATDPPPRKGDSCRADGCGFPLPLPSTIGVECFEARLDSFLNRGCYLNWMHDREIRATGPFINGLSYGTHPAVKVYYSPEMWEWMINGRRGDIPDGAMVIKEQYPTPARSSYTAKDRFGYAIMVRDKNASWDGWYWSSGVGFGSTSPYKPPFNYPWAGFGQYCVNCHASADNTFSTYSALRNVTGDPMTYLTVIPSMIPKQPSSPDIHTRLTGLAHLSRPSDTALAEPNRAFMALYNSIRQSDIPTPYGLPGESYDQVMQGPRPHGQKLFLTSDQCIGCHDGTQSNATLPNMIYTPARTSVNINLSPYGEWRSSMMGLAGRDPIFYAQLESERAIYPGIADSIDNTCFSCHGVMGKREMELEGRGPFTHDIVQATPETDPSHAALGALAREGISCNVCHHISEKGLGTEETYTGQFKTGPAEEIYGPFADPTVLPMENALGLTPKKTLHNQISSSALCGSCHTVELPILNPGKKYSGDPMSYPGRKSHEQSTYFEWRNSIYSNEGKTIPSTARTCQNCHMKGDYMGDTLKFRIANAEDETFPFVDNRAPDADIALKVRGGDSGGAYARHTMLGINLFAMKIFRQFRDYLGIRFTDPMATFGNPEPGMVTAERASLEMARESATIEVVSMENRGNQLEARVRVTNLAGHKFPSGVGFRRAFIELQVDDVAGNPVWASGRTSEMGVILDGISDRPLSTEFFAPDNSGQPGYQPHHDVITSGNQVQIYEELLKDSTGAFTTSFLSLATLVKDTRLMPKGWRSDGPDAVATKPDGGDGRPLPKGYSDGSGTDELIYRIPLDHPLAPGATLSARIYYQSIPPYYLRQRFTTAPAGEATRTLWYYTGRLDLRNSPIESWKLKVAEWKGGVK